MRVMVIILSVSLVGFLAPALIADPVTPDPCKVLLQEAGVNLSKLKSEGKLDKVVGPTEVAKKIVQVSQQNENSNIVLVGNKGVGRETQLQAAIDQLPKTSVVVKLDLADVRSRVGPQAGTMEAVLRRSLDEIKKKSEEAGMSHILLYVDNGAELTDEGNSGNKQVSPLAVMMAWVEKQRQSDKRIKYTIVTRATVEQYGQFKEHAKDAFNKIDVEPPGKDVIQKMARDIANEKQKQWGVKIDDSAVEEAVRLADNMTRPNSVIQLLDRAAARKKMLLGSENADPRKVAAYDEVNSQLQKLVIERNKSDDRLNVLIQKKALEEQAGRRLIGGELRELQSLDGPNGEVARLQAKIDPLEAKLKELGKDTLVVTAEDVIKAHRDAKSAGQQRFEEQVRDRNFFDTLRNAAGLFAKKLKGQPEAVQMAEDMVKTIALPRDLSRSIFNTMFVGPSTVGKTYLAELIAELIFGGASEESVITIDMGDFQEAHSGSKLIGAPPGYVGYEEGGMLIKKLRELGKGVVILDEFEKAHPAVKKLFLTALRNGYMVDGRTGEKVSTKDFIFVATSNAGLPLIERTLRENPDNPEIITKPEFLKKLRRVMIEEYGFPPELLNRFDSIVPFRVLTPEVLRLITKLEVEKLQKRSKAQKGFELILGDENAPVKGPNDKEDPPNPSRDEVLQVVSDFGYEPELGAKNVKDNVRRLIEDPAYRELLYSPGVYPEDWEGAKVLVTAIKDAENKAIGLKYELKLADGRVFGPLELRRESEDTFQLYDAKSGEKRRGPIAALKDDVKKPETVESGASTGGAEADVPRGPPPQIPLGEDAAKLIAEAERQLKAISFGVATEIDASLSKQIAEWRYSPSGGDSHIAKNIKELVTPRVMAIMASSEKAADKVELSWLAPDKSSGTLYPYGAVSVRLRSGGDTISHHRVVIDWQDGLNKWLLTTYEDNGRILREPGTEREVIPQTQTQFAPQIGFPNGQIIGPGFNFDSGQMLGNPAELPSPPQGSGQ